MAVPSVQAIDTAILSYPAAVQQFSLWTNRVTAPGVSNASPTAARAIRVPAGSIPVATVTAYSGGASTSNHTTYFQVSNEPLGASNYTAVAQQLAAVSLTLNGTNWVTAIQMLGTNVPWQYIQPLGYTTTAITTNVVARIGIGFIPAFSSPYSVR